VSTFILSLFIAQLSFVVPCLRLGWVHLQVDLLFLSMIDIHYVYSGPVLGPVIGGFISQVRTFTFLKFDADGIAESRLEMDF
jgi:hypothetical protein